MFSDVQRIKRQVIAITLLVSLCTFSGIFLAIVALAPHLPLLSKMSVPHMHVLAALSGTLMIARSPATAVAVLRETDGKGPYCSLVMAVVVMKDVLVFICFAINIEYVRVVMNSESGAMRAYDFLLPFLGLAMSVCLGLVAGIAVSLVLNWRASTLRPFAAISRRLGAAFTTRVKTVALAALAMSIFYLAEQLGAEPLLTCVLAGIVVSNRKGDQGGGQAAHDELKASLAHVMPVVNMAFFGLAGASVRLKPLVATLWAGAVLFAVRLAAVFMGSWLGAFIGGTPSEHRSKIWQGMITQAGVALGLTKIVSQRFPTWGPDFAALMVSVILFNLLAGPPLFKAAVVSAGEARALHLTPSSSPPNTPRSEHKHMRHAAKHLDSSTKANPAVDSYLGRNSADRLAVTGEQAV
ncbi:hypothetical protein WJX73_005312 [Symbiochloris irregularis]|uniref:Cation/H+ exchanger domain-containing protein n=1 Tax=Symbiochloris irregularis TaxID=706552 RepID=A0AAW1NNS9_9CHLO